MTKEELKKLLAEGKVKYIGGALYFTEDPAYQTKVDDVENERKLDEIRRYQGKE